MNTPKSLTAANGEQIAFYEHMPARDLPVIIFLHGQGETGDGTINTLPSVQNNAIPKYIKENRFAYATQFIVLTPQLKTAYKNEWKVWYIAEMIKYAKTVSNKAIFVTGLSLGGGACWNATDDESICSQIRGIYPVSATGTFNTPNFIKKYGVETWCFHAEDDGNSGTSPGNTTSAYQAIRAVAPELAKLTYYTTGGHSQTMWDKAYAMTNPTYACRNIDSWQISDVQQKPNIYEDMLQIAGIPITPPVIPPTPTPRKVIKLIYDDGYEQNV